MAHSNFYYLEFLPNIQSLLVVVSPPGGSRKLTFSSYQISATLQSLDSRNITQEPNPPSSLTLCSWCNTSLPGLIPSSLINLKTVPNEGIHVRFKTHPHVLQQQEIKESITSTLEVPPSAASSPTIVTMNCRHCRTRLMRQRLVHMQRDEALLYTINFIFLYANLCPTQNH